MPASLVDFFHIFKIGNLPVFLMEKSTDNEII